ncbi:hypothetical protein QJS10_CPB19g00603 [Acorus calamus]|uniref:Ubiquitin-like domain-containing protein n=1 Tax=Acorus calamus TaxID=4465 RepID=A0AAV9CG77_ACOCL|nr:hypothetical protein QJS10_CPB19g00603 [Acorus calamus]
MSSNGPGEISLFGGIEAEPPETTVEIKIKTLDSQTYTLRVNKFVPVPALKEQIATVTGVVSEQQRLICRGKVLKDEELLSAYHFDAHRTDVEDGHTLHLVVRQPFQPSTSPNLGLGSQSTSSHPVTDPASAGATNRGNHVGPNVVLRAFSVADSPEGHPADLNRIFSTLLGSMGIIGIGTGSEREHVLERVDRNSGNNGTSDSVQHQPATAAQRAQFDPLQGSFTSPAGFSSAPLQPIVIPDSLATLSQYLSQLRREFSANGEGNNIDAEASDGHGLEALHSHSSAGQGGLPTPQSLAEVILSTRRMLIAQAGECLLDKAFYDQGDISVEVQFFSSRFYAVYTKGKDDGDGVVMKNGWWWGYGVVV